MRSKSKTWGNGRDWTFPKQYEGDWIRIWPMKPVSNSIRQYIEPLKEVRNVVMEVRIITFSQSQLEKYRYRKYT